MGEKEQPASKYNISMGDVSGQVVIGDYNTVAQRVGLTPGNGRTEVALR